MGMGRFEEEDMLNHVQYFKSAAEIKDAVSRRISALEKKIEERVGRIEKLRLEYKINDVVWADITMQHGRHGSLTNSNYVSKLDTPKGEVEISVPAGVVSNLIEERELIKSEKTELKVEYLVVKHMHMAPEPIEVSLSDLQHYDFK